MTISRPLTKPVLKKMYLKALYEIKSPRGRYESHGWSVGSVLHVIPELFEIEKLNAEEQQIGYRAAYELERDGYIQQDATQSENHKILMDRGWDVASKPFDEIVIGWTNIDEFLTRDDLKSKVRDDYIEGDFESCVFKAFRLLEENVRAKAGQDSDTLGVSLMSVAFKKKEGVLNHPEAHVDAEVDGIHALMRGAIGWLKNPSSHRTVAHHDPQKTAHILAFANYLLDLVDECGS